MIAVGAVGAVDAVGTIGTIGIAIDVVGKNVARFFGWCVSRCREALAGALTDRV